MSDTGRIEVTPEMIQAGRSWLAGSYGVGAQVCEVEDSDLGRLYIAMRHLEKDSAQGAAHYDAKIREALRVILAALTPPLRWTGTFHADTDAARTTARDALSRLDGEGGQ